MQTPHGCPLPSACPARPRRVGDASRLAELAPLAAVVSCFGLQQMPQPAQVLAHWTRALRPGQLPACAELGGVGGRRAGSFECWPWLPPLKTSPLATPALAAPTSAACSPLAAGGVLCVCFWPQAVEDSGPWQRLAQLTAPSRPQPDWEADLPGAALREGAELLQVCWPGSLQLAVLIICHLCCMGVTLESPGRCAQELACLLLPAHLLTCCLLPAVRPACLPGCRTRWWLMRWPGPAWMPSGRP